MVLCSDSKSSRTANSVVVQLLSQVEQQTLRTPALLFT